jgi:hypothetical protein
MAAGQPAGNGTGTVTVNDLLNGQVTLDLECLDRVYLNLYVPNLQVAGQVVTFLQHRGYPIPSPACLRLIGEEFRRSVQSYAEANDIPVIRLRGADRKIDVMRPYLDRAAASGRSRVAAIGVAQELQNVFSATEKQTSNGIPWFAFHKIDRRVTCYYFYVWDADFGPAFIKICAYFPYPGKIWLNGHEWAKQQARQTGIGFTELSNGFASCTKPTALQAICDRLGPGAINVFVQRWLTRLPQPFTDADRDAGYWWETSMRQIETSRTLVFTQPRHARAFMEALVVDNIDIGRPEHVEIIFARQRGRKAGGTFKTKLDRHTTGITLNTFYRHSRIKQYLKDGRALRIETVINDAHDLGCHRRLHHLDELAAKARACNARLLDAERVGQGCVLASPVFERIAHPTVTAEGRRAPAMRFGDPRVQALAGALCYSLFAVTGFTNKSLRALMTGLLGGTTYTTNQASHDLARLRLNGLIQRVPRRNRYTLTPDGLRFAIFYTKVHDRILRPLLAADQPHVPPPIRAALRTLDQHIDQRLAHARLPTAA